MDPVVAPSLGLLATILKLFPFGSMLKNRARKKMNPRAQVLVEQAKREIREKSSIVFECGGGQDQADIQTAVDWLKADGYAYVFMHNYETKSLHRFIVRAGG